MAESMLSAMRATKAILTYAVHDFFASVRVSIADLC
jgi:hypothetical protein